MILLVLPALGPQNNTPYLGKACQGPALTKKITLRCQQGRILLEMIIELNLKFTFHFGVVPVIITYKVKVPYSQYRKPPMMLKLSTDTTLNSKHIEF